MVIDESHPKRMLVKFSSMDASTKREHLMRENDGRRKNPY
jgi:hypothetical protein